MSAKRKTTSITTPDKLGDFTMTPRALPISGLAIVIGFVSAFIALALLRLIGLFTNLFFFQRWSTCPGVAGRQPSGPLGDRWCRWRAR